MSAARRPRIGSDQRLILILAAVMLVLIVGVTVLAPQQEADSPTPASDNTGPLGVKAAYLTLQRLGHHVSRWKRPLSQWNASLEDDQAARTTLVILDPVYDAPAEAGLKSQLATFMRRGGRVLTTDPAGARLLGGSVGNPELLETLCRTTPDGSSDLALAGRVQFSDHGGWKLSDPQFHGTPPLVAQRCGQDIAVVQLALGPGSAVWWTSDVPMVNAELKQDPALKLVLASVGAGRDVVFVEDLHEVTRTLWDAASGLPIMAVSLQAAALFLLLLLSYSRRCGPVRMPLSLPRSSPLEFAASMGDLYAKGGATSAATEAARRRLLRVLTSEVGLSPEALLGGTAALPEALRQRLGAGFEELARAVADHLEEAAEAAHAQLAPGSALKLVQALGADAVALRKAAGPVRQRPMEPQPAGER